MARRAFKCPAKPLIVAGHGIRLAKAQDELMKVLEFGYPVVTTFNGFDLVPNEHPNYVGRIGTLGTYGGNNALRNCDLVYLIGTRNNVRQVSYHPETFAPQAVKVVVDIDMRELQKPISEKWNWINADAKEFLEQMNLWSDEVNKDWLKELRDFEKDNPIELTTPYKFINDLTLSLPEGSVVVCGNATACVCMFQAGIVKKGQRIFWNSGCAAMGYDLPAAIGAHYGSGKEVICITGDGSIQMNIQELQTIKHYNLPIKIFVLNNKGYRSIEMTQTNYFEGDFIGCNEESGVSFPDLSRIADAYGIDYGFTMADDNFGMEGVLERKGACICEVFIGNEYIFNPKFTRSL